MKLFSFTSVTCEVEGNQHFSSNLIQNGFNIIYKKGDLESQRSKVCIEKMYDLKKRQSFYCENPTEEAL